MLRLVRVVVVRKEVVASHLDAILVTPLFDDADDVFDLRIGCVAQHRHDVDKTLFWLHAGYNELEYSHAGAPLAFPVFRVRVETFEHVEGFRGVEKCSHFVAVIGNKLCEIKRISTRVHFEV